MSAPQRVDVVVVGAGLAGLTAARALAAAGRDVAVVEARDQVSGRTLNQRPAHERRDAVLRSFAEVAGPRALRPRGYVEQDWTSEEWTRGGPTSVVAPGVLTTLGDWRDRPFGRVRWAGTEHANHCNGHTDGAARSGEDAARAVLELQD